jgi:hypothetical protein
VKPHEIRNALLAVALCLIAIFTAKSILHRGGLRDLNEANTAFQKATSHVATYTIELSGTKGVAFNGTLGFTNPDGTYSSKSVEGALPATFTGEGSLASCNFQKQSEEGTLRLTLHRNGNIIGEEETTAAYGVLTLVK